jgi:hypothetical protein
MEVKKDQIYEHAMARYIAKIKSLRSGMLPHTNVRSLRLLVVIMILWMWMEVALGDNTTQSSFRNV